MDLGRCGGSLIGGKLDQVPDLASVPAHSLEAPRAWSGEGAPGQILLALLAGVLILSLGPIAEGREVGKAPSMCVTIASPSTCAYLC